MKRVVLLVCWRSHIVTPRAGVWIETGKPPSEVFIRGRHPPCGGVD